MVMLAQTHAGSLSTFPLASFCFRCCLDIFFLIYLDISLPPSLYFRLLLKKLSPLRNCSDHPSDCTLTHLMIYIVHYFILFVGPQLGCQFSKRKNFILFIVLCLRPTTVLGIRLAFNKFLFKIGAHKVTLPD